MFRHHRILYRRLLRGQSVEDLIALRGESSMFPTLLALIDDELQRRAEAGSAEDAAGSILDPLGYRPLLGPNRTPALS